MQRILLISVCGTDRGHEPSTTSHNFWYSKQAYLLDPYRGTGSFPAVPFPQLISGGALSPCLFISTFHPRGDLQPRNILSLFAGTKGKKKVTTNRAPACPGPRMLTKASAMHPKWRNRRKEAPSTVTQASRVRYRSAQHLYAGPSHIRAVVSTTGQST